jgi:hypothetical protein
MNPEAHHKVRELAEKGNPASEMTASGTHCGVK